MSGLANLTRYAAIALPSKLLDEREAMLVLMSARFRILKRGERLVRADEQPLPPLADEYYGDPGSSSLRVAGQVDAFRPGTDVYVTGHARALGRRPCIALQVRARVGPLEQRVLVVGDRRWQRTAVGEPVASKPTAFDRMPLTWEHAFGGTREHGDEVLSEPRNPVGRGLIARIEDADGQMLPNLESPDQPIRRVMDRPTPIGLGPIARGWEPRQTLSGTYDQAWMEQRAPYWPDDLDPRFFHAAAPGLQSREPLQGGEPVELEGMHPEGVVSFRLPRMRWKVQHAVNQGTFTSDAVLSAVHLEPDVDMVTLCFRSVAPTPRGLDDWRGTIVECDFEPVGVGAA